MSQSGLGLPDESYYRDPQHAAILAEYPKHIARMFALVYGEQEADWDATATQIVALETKIAAAHWDVVKRRDADLTYNLRTFDELSSEATGFDWAVWLHGLGADPSGDRSGPLEVVVSQPDALTAFAALWESEDIEDWKRWLRWRVISGRASMLTDDLVDENFEFYGRTLIGHRGVARPLEARRRAGRERDGRGRRPALRGAALPAGGQGPDGRAGRQPAARPTGAASPTWSG